MGDAVIAYEQEVEDHIRTINEKHPPVLFAIRSCFVFHDWHIHGFLLLNSKKKNPGIVGSLNGPQCALIHRNLKG